jgi:hypothetical protein
MNEVDLILERVRQSNVPVLFKSPRLPALSDRSRNRLSEKEKGIFQLSVEK